MMRIKSRGAVGSSLVGHSISAICSFALRHEASYDSYARRSTTGLMSTCPFSACPERLVARKVVHSEAVFEEKHEFALRKHLLLGRQPVQLHAFVRHARPSGNVSKKFMKSYQF